MSETEAMFRSGIVALAGRPNAGKSTLLNRLVGQKLSIVTDRPQTTRTIIHGVVRRPGAQMVVVDAPGLHRPEHRMNERMLGLALGALEGADVVLAVSDVTQPPGPGDAFLIERLRRVTPPVFLALNKIDLLGRKDRLLPLIDRWAKTLEPAELFPISAARGEGVEELLSALLARLPEGPELYPEDVLTNLDDRFRSAEIVREKLIRATHAELPYSTAVLIDELGPDETNEGLLRIEGRILVERDSQKGIVIGKGGAVLKRIGSEARLELEHLFGQKVFLGLRVVVRGGWRDDEGLLDRLGIPGGS